MKLTVIDILESVASVEPYGITENGFVLISSADYFTIDNAVTAAIELLKEAED